VRFEIVWITVAFAVAEFPSKATICTPVKLVVLVDVFLALKRKRCVPADKFVTCGLTAMIFVVEASVSAPFP
jgi:hypothetical protein